jgi:natural product precursor
MKKAHSKEKLTLNSETIRHLKDLTERELRHVQGGSIDTHTGFWWCTSTQQVGGG